VLLSVQERFTWVVETTVAVNPLGAIGTTVVVLVLSVVQLYKKTVRAASRMKKGFISLKF
jgi:hypothetical protein